MVVEAAAAALEAVEAATLHTSGEVACCFMMVPGLSFEGLFPFPCCSAQQKPPPRNAKGTEIREIAL